MTTTITAATTSSAAAAAATSTSTSTTDTTGTTVSNNTSNTTTNNTNNNNSNESSSRNSTTISSNNNGTTGSSSNGSIIRNNNNNTNNHRQHHHHLHTTNGSSTGSSNPTIVMNNNTSFAVPLVKGLLACSRQQNQNQKNHSHSQEQQPKFDTCTVNDTTENHTDNNNKDNIIFNSTISIVNGALYQIECIRLIQRTIRKKLLSSLTSIQQEQEQQTLLTLFSENNSDTKNNNKRLSNNWNDDELSITSPSAPPAKRFKGDTKERTINNTNLPQPTADGSYTTTQGSTSTSTSTSTLVSEHWLWKSMRAYSVAERKSILHIIVSSLSFNNYSVLPPVSSPMIQSTMPSITESNTSTSNNEIHNTINVVQSYFQQKRFQYRLSNHIMYMLDQYVIPQQQKQKYSSRSSYNSNNIFTVGNVASKGHLALEWISLLELLWTSIFTPPNTIMSQMYSTSSSSSPSKSASEKRTTTSAAVAVAVAVAVAAAPTTIPQLPSSSVATASSTSSGGFINEHLAEKYWNWLTYSIWLCACQLRKEANMMMTTSTGNTSTVAVDVSLPETSDTAITLASLSHLALVLAIRREITIPSSSSSSSSPLPDTSNTGTSSTTKCASPSKNKTSTTTTNKSTSSNLALATTSTTSTALGSTSTSTSSSKKPAVTNSKSSDARQRSNSNTSNMSSSSLSLRQRSNSTTVESTGTTPQTPTASVVVDHVLKSIQYFNSKLLWNISDSENNNNNNNNKEKDEKLSPLACLVGACWIVLDISFHPTLQNNHTNNNNSSNRKQSIYNVPGSTRSSDNKNSNSKNASTGKENKHFCGGGNLLLSSSGGGNNSKGSTTLIALRRAAHTLEQLINLSKDCEVLVIDNVDNNDKTKKKRIDDSNGNCTTGEGEQEKQHKVDTTATATGTTKQGEGKCETKNDQTSKKSIVSKQEAKVSRTRPFVPRRQRETEGDDDEEDDDFYGSSSIAENQHSNNDDDEDMADIIEEEHDDMIDDADDLVLVEASDIYDDEVDEHNDDDDDDDPSSKEAYQLEIVDDNDKNNKEESTVNTDNVERKDLLDDENHSKSDNVENNRRRYHRRKREEGAVDELDNIRYDGDDDLFDEDEEFSHIPDEEEEDNYSISIDREVEAEVDENDEGTVQQAEEDVHGSQVTDATTEGSQDIEVELEGDVDDDDAEEDDEEEEEEDDDDDDDDDEEVDDDDDCADVVDEMDLDELTAAVENAKADLTSGSRSNENKEVDGTGIKVKLSPSLDERKIMYVKACLEVLSLQHRASELQSAGIHHKYGCSRYLSLAAEDSVLGTLNDIVKPPKKPLNIQIMMRRAPTQEEFFRGSLTHNPILLSSLGGNNNSSSSNNTSSNSSRRLSGSDMSSDFDPTVSDLRQQIANDLQMSDSAEMIEIIVANKILDVGLKLRVVHQVLWKNHLMENAAPVPGSSLAALFGPGSSSGSSTNYFTSAGSTISMIFSSANAGSSDRGRITRDTMVAMYRLVGVDGEATEDTVRVSDLIDPEKPSESASPEQAEQLLENEYGVTKLMVYGQRVVFLLRSVQHAIHSILRKIRRDDVGCDGNNDNPSRVDFKSSPPCHALTLLGHCSRLASNRKILLQARAPTVLLTLLLDVLKILEDETSTNDTSIKSNRTAELLQELIEVLTSDISSSGDDDTDKSQFELSSEEEVSSMSLLMESIETISLSPPLRNVIAKLLPFLTYGHKDLSHELANRINTNILFERLTDNDNDISKTTNPSDVLMTTFIQSILSLQRSGVCNALRLELLTVGFLERIAKFILQDMPQQPPPWSIVLQTDSNMSDSQKLSIPDLEIAWKHYYSRSGLKTVFKMMTSLCMNHDPTQSSMVHIPEFLLCCHWIETTLDNTSANVDTKGLGLVAETLLDEVVCVTAHDQVDSLRKQTRKRKREIAENRRKLALKSMKNFSITAPLPSGAALHSDYVSPTGSASILAPVTNTPSSPLKKQSEADTDQGKISKPDWLAEAETLEDENGLTCAVCKEGRTLNPSEVIGLYAYVKKVSIPVEQCASRAGIDGTNLLRALPATLPDSLHGCHVEERRFQRAKSTAEQVAKSQSISLHVSSHGGGRNSVFTTTVSAGTGIHISCHRKARQEDRLHPKAPKSEWEGASLRNNRCNCNVILPLVSSRSSKVPLIAVEAALTDHQAAVSNLLGSNPKSGLWTVLHDTRFLLLRIAYGEALNADCGGGSLTSNCQLLYYQMLMADMFDHDAHIDQPQVSLHARGLSCALLTGCAILTAKDAPTGDTTTTLARSVADAATMACFTSILFRNSIADDTNIDQSLEETSSVHSKRQWAVGNEYFLKSLLICAGRRHVQGIDSSGCQNSRIHRTKVQRVASFASWEIADEMNTENEGESLEDAHECEIGEHKASSNIVRKKNQQLSSATPTLEDFQNVLRPMITYFAIMNQLSSDFSVALDDANIYECAQRLESIILSCQRSKNIRDLLEVVNIISMKSEDMIELVHLGMCAAA